MNEPKISVIVPVYNIAQYLPRCLDSLLAQDFQDLEIIVVDDGSKDDSGAICDAYAAKDPRIQVIHQANSNVSNARNSGLAVAKGEYISFIDGDDCLVPGAYTALMEKAGGCRPDVIYYGRTRIVDEKHSDVRLPPYEEGLYEEDALRAMRLDIIGSRYVLDYRKPQIRGVWAMLMKRALLEEANLRFYSERRVLNEDYLFVMQLLWIAKSVYIVRYPYYSYMIRNGSLTTSYRANMQPRKQVLYGIYQEFLPEDDEEVACRMRNFYISSMYVCAVEEINAFGPFKAIPRVRSILSDPYLRTCLRENSGLVNHWKSRCKYLLMRLRLAGAMYCLYRVGKRLLRK